MITCALNSARSPAGSTRRPAIEPVGKEFFDQGLSARDARGGVRDLFVAEVSGRDLAGKAVVLVVKVFEQFPAEANYDDRVQGAAALTDKLPVDYILEAAAPANTK